VTVHAIVFTEAAQRQLEALPDSVHKRLARVVPLLLAEPFRPRPGLDVKPLTGHQGLWRLRIGHYRGIYCLDGSTLRFLRFGHRSTVYR